MGLGRSVGLAVRGFRNYYGKKPFSVSFEVTHSCNAKCKHCHLRGMLDDEVRVDAARYAEICREIRPVVAQISGGEPLLRKDLEEIVSALAATGPATALTTNAALLSRDRFTSLRNAGLDEYSISLDYPDERHDEFRGIPGLFGKIADLMSWLRSTGETCVTLGCVVQSDNYRSIPEMAELATKWGVKLNLSSYTPLRTENMGYMLAGDQIDEFEEMTHALVDQRKKHGNIRTSRYAFDQMLAYFRNGRAPRCQAGTRFFNVNPDGTMSPCGLIITDFPSQGALIEGFSRTNDCEMCLTSLRLNCEKPVKYMIADNLSSM